MDMDMDMDSHTQLTVTQASAPGCDLPFEVWKGVISKASRVVPREKTHGAKRPYRL